MTDRGRRKSKGALNLISSEPIDEPPRLPLASTVSATGADHALDDRGHNEADNEFFIPVHGFVDLTDQEVAVVNHPAFQRLGFINQLGQSNLVFRGASHTRFEHVLGALFVAQEMVDSVDRNRRRLLRKARRHPQRLGKLALEEPLSPTEEVFIRLGALLHDIGHLPAGHTLEDELEFLDKHDKTPRMDRVLDRKEWPGYNGPTLREIIDREFADELESDEISPSELAIQLVAKDGETSRPKENSVARKILRLQVCRDIIGDTICADLLDYLHRDWHHLGKPRYFDKRLFQYMEIRHVAGESTFVLNIGGYPKVRSDAITAILSLLESRYELAETVLFHRTKCTAAAMLERALFELEESVSDNDVVALKATLEDALLDATDEGALNELTEAAKARSARAALLSLNCLRNRQLYATVSTTLRAEFSDAQREHVDRLFRGGRPGAQARNRAMRILEADFGLPAGSLAIYCPDRGMNAKIAKVQLMVNDSVKTLEEWDTETSRLAGGHLQAQLARFESLWRVHVVAEREMWEKFSEEKRDVLQEAVRICVLGKLEPNRPLEVAVRQLAKLLSACPDNPHPSLTIRESSEDVPKAARAGTEGPLEYPGGAPAIRAFLQ